MGATTNFMNQMGQYPTPTDPYQAAQQTSAGNLYGAQAATSANRVNQVTPYGSLNYSQTGTDANGNPIYSATQTLSPELQGIYANLASQVGQASQSPFDVSRFQQQTVGGGPSFTNAQSADQMQMFNQNADVNNFNNENSQELFNQNAQLQTSLGDQGMQAWDRASGLVMQRLQPQLERQSKQLDTQLAQQGIMPGSEAYNTAKQQLAQGQNDLLNQAQMTGLNAQNQFFGQGLQAGQFGNAAQQQMYQNALNNVNQRNAAQQQNFQNAFNTNQYNNLLGQQNYQNAFNNVNQQNQAAQQNFQNAMLTNQYNNQLAQQGYGNQLAQQQANNAALQANYGQNLTAYQMPMSQLAAFRSATAPNYVNPYQQAAVSGPDYSTAYAQQQASNISQQNADTARQAAMMGGLFNLGGTALSNPQSIANIGSGLGSLYNTVSNWW